MFRDIVNFNFTKNWKKKLGAFFMCMVTSYKIFFPFIKKILLIFIGKSFLREKGNKVPLFS